MTTYTARSFEKAQFAHHPDGRVAARINDHEYPWAGLNVGGTRENFGDGEMARKGWIPMRECPDPEQHEVASVALEHPATEGVGESHLPLFEAVNSRLNELAKAEQERDEANDALAEYVKARVARDPLTAREHLEAAWEAAHVPEGNIPEGADYITRWDDGRMAYRKAESPYLASWEVDIYGDRSERRLLDPPAPSRPEGAEGVEMALLDADEAGFFNIAPRAIQDLADWLAAERGVRVTTEEGR